MKCCILSCKSYSGRQSNIADGITFHAFPTDEFLKQKWIDAINRSDWTPTKHTKICSLHFNSNNFVMSSKRLCSGAIPCLKLGTQEFQEDVPQLLQIGQRELEKVCRICLAVDRKVWNIQRYNLRQSYEEIMGQTLNGSLPLSLCWECAHKLLSCARFKTKMRNAHKVMMDLLHRNNNLTPQIIQTVNRKANNLESNLSIRKIEYNSTDSFFNDDNDIADTCDDVKDIKQDIEISDIKVEFECNYDFDEHLKCKDEPEGAIDDSNQQGQSSLNDAVSKESNETKHESHVDQNLDVDKKSVINEDENLLASNHEESPANDAVLTEKATKVIKKRTGSVKKKETEGVKKKKTESVKQKKAEGVRKSKQTIEPIDDSIFTVVNLSHEESLQEIEKRKESENYLYSAFKCSECYKGFLDEDAYKVHCIRHTNESGTYVCNVCKVHFHRRRSWKNHAVTHLHKFICKTCPYITFRRTNAKLHEKFHKGKIYQCSQCGMVFGVKTTYLGHLRKKHPSDFVCEQCGYNFLSTKGLIQHKQLKHKFDEFPVTENGAYCEVCDIRFTSDDALSNHFMLSAKHASDRENKDVTSTPRSAPKIKKKRVVFYRPKPKAKSEERCEQCDMPMPDARSYYAHFKKHHPDKNRTKFAASEKTKVMCEVCGKIFQNKCLLRDHSSSHSGEGPFPCDQCGKTFVRRFRLLTHQKLHGERQTFACPICEKEYSSISNMRRHCFIHTGLKPFKCEMCDKCFKNSSDKKSHITYVHLKKPWPKRNRGKRGEKQEKQTAQSSEIKDGSETE